HSRICVYSRTLPRSGLGSAAFPPPRPRSLAPVPEGRDQLGALLRSRLAQDRRHVQLDGLLLDAERGGDLLVGPTIHERDEDLDLARGEAVSPAEERRALAQAGALALHDEGVGRKAGRADGKQLEVVGGL